MSDGDATGAVLSQAAALSIPDGFPYPGIVRTLHRQDAMFDDNDQHYLSVGLSALAGIDRALARRPAPFPVTRVLDLACGHGRVTRALQARFPDARITVSDIDPEAVAFCARSFAARGIASRADLDSLDLGESFELIWVGSLLTHLDAGEAESLLRCCLRHLAEGGIAVVSAHGAYVAGRIAQAVRDGEDAYGVSAPAAAAAIEDYFSVGYGFAAYDWAARAGAAYGISLASEAWLRARACALGGGVLAYEPHAWDRHHDLITLAAANAVRCA